MSQICAGCLPRCWYNAAALLDELLNGKIFQSLKEAQIVVIVLDMPEIVEGDGFRANLRRPVQSPSFTETFGENFWKAYYTPADDIGRLIPQGKMKSSGKRNLVLIDRNGVRHECIAESFTQRHQVFVLIHSVRTLTAKFVLLSA